MGTGGTNPGPVLRITWAALMWAVGTLIVRLLLEVLP